MSFPWRGNPEKNICIMYYENEYFQFVMQWLFYNKKKGNGDRKDALLCSTKARFSPFKRLVVNLQWYPSGC